MACNKTMLRFAFGVAEVKVMAKVTVINQSTENTDGFIDSEESERMYTVSLQKM